MPLPSDRRAMRCWWPASLRPTDGGRGPPNRMGERKLGCNGRLGHSLDIGEVWALACASAGCSRGGCITRCVIRLVAIVCVGLAAGAGPAHAERRVALVIGNAKYAHEEQLKNPGNDAREVAAALKRIAFDDVDVVLDADLIQMQSALARFARKADAADLALIYYSGHGIEVDGRNYLIPTSARLADAGDVDFETVPLDLAIAAADRAGKVKILVLDACRNNPFRARIVLKQGKRSVGRGFAPVAAAHGMLVAYSARPRPARKPTTGRRMGPARSRPRS